MQSGREDPEQFNLCCGKSDNMCAVVVGVCLTAVGEHEVAHQADEVVEEEGAAGRPRHHRSQPPESRPLELDHHLRRHRMLQ